MTIYGKVDCLIPTGPPNSSYWINGLFKATWDFFKWLETQNVCTEIARFNGVYPPAYILQNQTTAGTGYPGDADPFGNNAWFVFRMNPTVRRPFPYYVHFHFANWTTFGNLTNHTALYRGSGATDWSNIGIQIARGVGGNQNPWNGTTNLGSAIKGPEPYWVPPPGGSRVHVLPRSNDDAGAHESTRKNMAGFGGEDYSTNCRAHFVCDGDSFVILHNAHATSTNHAICFAGLFNGPFPDRLGLITCDTNFTIPIPTTDIGGIQSNPSFDGGVICPTKGSFTIRHDRPPLSVAAAQFPNKQYSPNRFDEHGFMFWGVEPGAEGYLGTLPTELITYTWGVSNHDTSTNLERAFFGTNPLVCIPWTGIAPPGTNMTRDGVQFIR